MESKMNQQGTEPEVKGTENPGSEQAASLENEEMQTQKEDAETGSFSKADVEAAIAAGHSPRGECGLK